MYSKNDYLNFTSTVSKLIELETINRDINIDILTSINPKDERVAEFIATNNIEGDILSKSQALMFLKKIDKEELSKIDLEKRWIGIKPASDYVWSNSFEFSLEHIHQAHRTLLRDVETPGGVFKTKINQAGSLVTTHPEDVSKEMMMLFTEYVSSALQGHTVFNIIPFISEFLAIHPYEDGNGRISRLLFNRMIYDAGYKFSKYVSISKYLWEDKDRYIEALESRNDAWARKQMTPQSLIPLFDVLLDALTNAAKHARLISKRTRYTEERFKEEIVKILADERSFSQIKESLNMSNSDASIKKWLAKLVTDNLIKRKGIRKTTKYYL